MAREGSVKKEEEGRRPRINFRPLLFCALGLVYGVYFYFRIRIGGLSASDFCLPAALLLVSLFPISWKRVLALFVAVLVFAGAGVGFAHLNAERYLSGPEEGEYAVSGTVERYTVKSGYMRVRLTALSFDGVPVDGKMTLNLSGTEAQMGDILLFDANVTREELPMPEEDWSKFYEDVRYSANSSTAQVTGTTRDPFLLARRALFASLDENMGKEEAAVAYALLTGDSSHADGGLLDEIRTSGIAHIFAVSGLHIGLLFSVVLLLFTLPLKRKAFFPAIAAALLYTAFCSFSVSATRALIMCAVLGGYRVIFRKYDFLQSISLAAVFALFACPADLFSAGFLLSFGACLGLALFAGPLGRLFGRIPHFPRFLSGYLSANLSVQLFTFPVLLQTFGYYSVWGFAFNLVVIPLLPVLFLPVLLCSFLALAIPPAAAALLTVPESLLSLLLFFYARFDFSFALRGFSLGMGAAVLLFGLVMLSEKVRLRRLWRLLAAGALGVLFTIALLLENVVFTGVRIDVLSTEYGIAALLRTPENAVLVMDGEVGLDSLEDFLNRRYAGTLDGVFVLSERELDGINRAAFLDTEAIFAKEEIDTGLQFSPVRFGTAQTVGEMSFRYVTRSNLLFTAEDFVLEFCFGTSPTGSADGYLDEAPQPLHFFLKDGIMREI